MNDNAMTDQQRADYERGWRDGWTAAKELGSIERGDGAYGAGVEDGMMAAHMGEPNRYPEPDDG